MKSFFRLFSIGIVLFLVSIFQLSAQNDSIKKSRGDTLVIVGVGDVMLGTIIPSREFLPSGEDCSKEFQNVKHIFQQADVAFCNLEGVFTDSPNGHKPCNNDNCDWMTEAGRMTRDE